jgi:hypothetical protein
VRSAAAFACAAETTNQVSVSAREVVVGGVLEDGYEQVDIRKVQIQGSTHTGLLHIIELEVVRILRVLGVLGIPGMARVGRGVKVRVHAFLPSFRRRQTDKTSAGRNTTHKQEPLGPIAQTKFRTQNDDA